MAHNNEACGSGTDGQRSRQLSLDEADIMFWDRIPVLLEFKLPRLAHVARRLRGAAASGWGGDVLPHRGEAGAHVTG